MNGNPILGSIVLAFMVLFVLWVGLCAPKEPTHMKFIVAAVAVGGASHVMQLPSNDRDFVINTVIVVLTAGALYMSILGVGDILALRKGGKR